VERSLRMRRSAVLACNCCSRSSGQSGFTNCRLQDQVTLLNSDQNSHQRQPPPKPDSTLFTAYTPLDTYRSTAHHYFLSMLISRTIDFVAANPHPKYTTTFDAHWINLHSFSFPALQPRITLDVQGFYDASIHRNMRWTIIHCNRICFACFGSSN
jgi:hypothetical protein